MGVTERVDKDRASRLRCWRTWREAQHVPGGLSGVVVGRREEGDEHAGVEGQRVVQHGARPARGEEANSFASRRRQSHPNKGRNLF